MHNTISNELNKETNKLLNLSEIATLPCVSSIPDSSTQIFNNFSNILIQKDRNNLLNMINDYNKYANDLEKIIIINN